MRIKLLTVMFPVIAVIASINSYLNPARERDDAKTRSFIVDTLAAGLSTPWDIIFLPGSDMLVTERPGRVRLFQNGKLQTEPVLTIDSIEATGKMGLLGMCLHPMFSENHFIYLAYNYRIAKETFLRIARYKYIDRHLINGSTIIEHIPGVFNHTGSRIKFGPDKKLYMSTGDADVPKLAQDLKVFNGKILRLNDDGTIPSDNPFIHNDTALHQIWTYGHRNPQGLAFQPGTNFLYDSEHGPTGGDEINLIKKGNNYGWPIIHHRDKRDGMIFPMMEFTPSIGPAEALFYTGLAFPGFKNHLLVACMRGEAILDVNFVENKISSYSFLLKNKYGRIRAIAQGPDGFLYISTSQVDPPESKMQPDPNGFDLILRLRPMGSDVSQGFVITDSMKLLNAAINNATTASRIVLSSSARTKQTYTQLCAGCHGAKMNGKDNIPSLVDSKWLNGNSRAAITNSITQGIVSKGMPAWDGVLSSAEAGRMADYIRSNKIVK